MKQKELTLSEAKELFAYDPDSGLLTWRKSLSRRVRVGDRAGEITKKGYLRTAIRGQRYSVHRLIWFIVYGKWPTLQIDHIDGNESNNRIANLREATPSQNGFNRGRPKNNTTGFKGVTFVDGSYEARIRINGERIRLGRFKQASEASAAYEAAAKTHAGEFARAA